MGQLGSTVQEDLLTEIDPVEVKQIKGAKNDAVGARLNGSSQRIKVGCTAAILDDGLAIYDC